MGISESFDFAQSFQLHSNPHKPLPHTLFGCGNIAIDCYAENEVVSRKSVCKRVLEHSSMCLMNLVSRFMIVETFVQHKINIASNCILFYIILVSDGLRIRPSRAVKRWSVKDIWNCVRKEIECIGWVLMEFSCRKSHEPFFIFNCTLSQKIELIKKQQQTNIHTHREKERLLYFLYQ